MTHQRNPRKHLRPFDSRTVVSACLTFAMISCTTSTWADEAPVAPAPPAQPTADEKGVPPAAFSMNPENTPKQEYVVQNKGWIIAGSIGVALGAGLAVGTLVYGIEYARGTDRLIGLVGPILGVGIMVGGVRAIVLGAQKVPKSENKTSVVSPRPAIFIGAGSIMVRGQF